MIEVALIATAAALRWASFGGGIYETALVDPVWPRRPDIIRPREGGISRGRFWIPMHVFFELTLIASLAAAWGMPDVRRWLLVALVAHGTMRAWSAVDFIPKALRFERGDGTLTRADAERWARASKLRLPLDLIAGVAMVMALIAVTRVAP